MKSKIETPERKQKKRKREFLLTLFDNEDKYQVIEMNEYSLVKSFDKQNNHWIVNIFTIKEHTEHTKKWEEKKKEREEKREASKPANYLEL